MADKKEKKIIKTSIEDNIFIASLNDPDDKVNKLSKNVFYEINELIDQFEQSTTEGLIFLTEKKDCFIAGADINDIMNFKSEAEAVEGSKNVQKLFDRLEALNRPTLAAINGACMGGGLELSLACKYRIVTDSSKTILALPEVMLGVLPGAGGTQRLPKVVGLQAALDMIMTGKNIRAKKAVKMGLADEMIPAELYRELSLKIFRNILKGKFKDNRPGINNFKDLTNSKKSMNFTNYVNLALDKTKPGNMLVFKKAKEALLKKTRGLYPAPELALEAIKAGYLDGMKKGLEVEAENFGKLAIGSKSQAFVHLFFATNELKKENGTANRNAEVVQIKNMAVLGGGLMGAGIAAVGIDKCGCKVRVKDIDYNNIGYAYNYVYDIFKDYAKKQKISKHTLPIYMGKLSGTCNYNGFKNSEMIIEAVFEDLNLKRRVLKECEEVTSDKCIFATNTSTLSIADIARDAKYPEKVIGMHFFSPVHKMPLLEIIVIPQNPEWVIATCVEFGKKMGKHVIVVNNKTGFYTSRILAPYINEAAYLFYEGNSVDDIDGAMMDWGFPVGPLTLLDEVGIDVAAKVTDIMLKNYGDRLKPPDGWHAIIDDGRYGRKNKKGFYNYKSKKKGVDPSIYKLLPSGVKQKTADFSEIQQRCGYGFVNEAALCLEENVLRTPRDGDVGAVFGLGFPPFTGGPFNFLDQYGVAKFTDELKALYDRFGNRFKPAQILLDYAKKDKKFFKSSN